jgi:hypothetical protein
MVKFPLIILLAFMANMTFAQQGPYSPQAGTQGSNAIHKDSNIIRFWATSCNFHPGYRQIDLPDSGFVSSGSLNYTTGKADAPLTVSFGDSGSAVLTFSGNIFDGPGYDFVVFENGFGFGEEAFLELAFVEVSSNGVDFFRFPAKSELDTNSQLESFAYTDASYYHNLAGKFIANYGVPFDLSEISETALLDKSAISHIRLVDVIGTINPEFASRDSDGNMINDPWPTNFAQGGFDLDAVGVINSTIPLSIHALVQWNESETISVDLLGRRGNGETVLEIRQNPDGSILKIIRAH